MELCSLCCDRLEDFWSSRYCFEDITFGGDSDRSRFLLRPSVLLLIDSDDEGDLDDPRLPADMSRSPGLLSPRVMTLGGDRDRPLLRRLSVLLLPLGLRESSSLDRDEPDEEESSLL